MVFYCDEVDRMGCVILAWFQKRLVRRVGRLYGSGLELFYAFVEL
jgi:hypothetical protein